MGGSCGEYRCAVAYLCAVQQVILHRKKLASVQRRHPWVFSGAIFKKPADLADGARVSVVDDKQQQLAVGHYQDGSIAVRLFHFGTEQIGIDFWSRKIRAAYALRERLGLTTDPDTNCYRLVHAEGDGLPGLIIDVYGSTAVLQCHSIGMHHERKHLTAAVAALPNIEAVYDKSAAVLPERYATEVGNAYLHGTAAPGVVREHGHTFYVDWETGQKTGFFLDQRDNRQLLTHYAADRTVLNAFCYSGGFSVYALGAGARHVTSVDVSKPAIGWTDRNVALNGNENRHTSHAADVLRFLRENETRYEVNVIDPPAFAKNVRKRHNAVQGYKRLNALAIQRTAPGGLLFTFSCSQVVDRELFRNTLTAAAIEAGREVRILHHLSQPADHPVSAFHPEGGYLKGLVCQVV